MMVEHSTDLPSFVLYPSDIDKIELLKLVFKLSKFYISTVLQYQLPSMSIVAILYWKTRVSTQPIIIFCLPHLLIA